MGLRAAAAQLLVVGAILGAAVLYTRHHVSTLQRADHTSSIYMEDSKAGNGTRYRVLKRAAETDNAYYTIEVDARGTAVGYVHGLAGSTPAHEHLIQDEELKVVSGKLGFIKGPAMREGGVLLPGETLTIPKGTPHSIYNADNSTDCVYELTHRPAGVMGERLFESIAGLGWDYTSSDRVHPLQVLVLYDAAAARLTDLPSFLQPVVNEVLVPLGRFLGFQPEYAGHGSSPEASHDGSAAAVAAAGEDAEVQLEADAQVPKEEL